MPFYRSHHPIGAVNSVDGPKAARFPPANLVGADQVHRWAFLGWWALADANKYLHRNSLWEAHDRLHQARDHIWVLWAAAQGALYPWHGLSQALDRDPRDLPPGIDATVAGLDRGDLRRAARAGAEVLSQTGTLAARRCSAELPTELADFITAKL